MASKKGIGVTVGILAAITIASFLIWTIPQNIEQKLVVTDFESHLEGVKKIHQIILESIDLEFQSLVNGEITPEEYVEIAEVSTSQINSQIIQLVESKPSESWQESYLIYLDALKKTNVYIRETMVTANLIEDAADNEKILESINYVNQLKTESFDLIHKSNELRP